MVAWLKLNQLFAMAGGCGVAVGCMALLAAKQRNKLVNQGAFLMDAVQILKEQPVTKELLGHELEVGKAMLGDGWSTADKYQVKLRLPIIGEHDKAILYAYARRKSDKERYRLYRLEATFEKVVNKKLILMDRTNEDPENDPEIMNSKDEKDDKSTVVTPLDKKSLYIEQMRSWQPVK